MTSRLFALVGTLLVGAAMIHATTVRESVPLRHALVDLPSTVGGWQSRGDIPLDPSTRRVLRADDYLDRTYTHQDATVDLFIGYYASQQQGDTMHSPMNCLPAAGWEPVSIGRAIIPMADGQLNTNRYVIQKGFDERLVFYWYQAHGRTVASEYASKMYLVFDSVRLHRSDAALIRVIAPIAGDIAASERGVVDFVRSLYPVLNDYIPGGVR